MNILDFIIGLILLVFFVIAIITKRYHLAVMIGILIIQLDILSKLKDVEQKVDEFEIKF